MEAHIVYLDAPVRPYAWGSHTVLAELQGRSAPTDQPEAEIWYGAHPLAPALVGRDTGFVGLNAYIAMDPRAMLGNQLLARFGDQLPFMLKILAVERPLSIQAHPDRARARAGFMEETRRRIPLAAPQRSYRDPRPKPELVTALTPFDALVGFRPQEELDLLLAAWAQTGKPLEQVVHELLRGEQAAQYAASWAERSQGAEGVLGEAATLFAELREIYPEDQGLPVAMLLNRVQLEPGQALFLGPGLLHAYLKGTAVEVMGNSDNTLRCGLTEKYIDADELMAVVRFEPQPVEVLIPERHGQEAVFSTDTHAFQLSILEVKDHLLPEAGSGPDILLCTEGECLVSHGRRSVSLGPGEACFVPHTCEGFALSGQGTVFRARAGL